MLDTNVKIAIRGVTRQKLFSGINILGLAVGITACMLILMYVRDELSYDNYHPYAERTARIAVEGALGGNKFELAVTSAPMAAAMLADYPEVEYATRVSSIFGFPAYSLWRPGIQRGALDGHGLNGLRRICPGTSPG